MRYLIKKSQFFGRGGLKLSHICEMNITFRSNLRNKTYKHYRGQPKPMIQWILDKKRYKNLEIIKTLEKMPLPLLKKYNQINLREYVVNVIPITLHRLLVQL